MKQKVINTLLGCILIYFVIAMFTYRFRYPKQSETELFIHIPDAMMWK